MTFIQSKLTWRVAIVLLVLALSYANQGQPLGFIIVASLYLLPSIVAYRRKHPQQNAIFLVNVLFGWSIIGWIIPMIWAVTAPKRIDADGFISS